MVRLSEFGAVRVVGSVGGWRVPACNSKSAGSVAGNDQDTVVVVGMAASGPCTSVVVSAVVSG